MTEMFLLKRGASGRLNREADLSSIVNDPRVSAKRDLGLIMARIHEDSLDAPDPSVFDAVNDALRAVYMSMPI